MLPRLEALRFKDVVWGDSPIVALSNYRTVVLHNLQTLSVLDGVVITQELKSHGMETAMKRVVYYESQKRKLKTTFRNLKKQSEEGRQVNSNTSDVSVVLMLPGVDFECSI